MARRSNCQNLLEMSDLKVPIIAVIIGEGGSGGALALGLADEVWMLKKRSMLCFPQKDLRRFCGKTAVAPQKQPS